jgi:hypothetical protein
MRNLSAYQGSAYGVNSYYGSAYGPQLGVSVPPPFGGHATLATGLVSYWKLDETSGSRIDSHGDYDLTDNNTVGSAAGKSSLAASFTLEDAETLSASYVRAADAAFSVSFWYKPPTYTVSDKFLLTDPEDAFSVVVRSSTGRTKVAINQNDISVQWAAASIPTVNQWHFLVAWHDPVANTITISIDNVSSSSTASTGGTPLGAGTALSLGGNPGVGGYFTGFIDEVAVWEKVLTSGERTDLYSAGAGLFY